MLKKIDWNSVGLMVLAVILGVGVTLGVVALFDKAGKMNAETYRKQALIRAATEKRQALIRECMLDRWGAKPNGIFWETRSGDLIKLSNTESCLENWQPSGVAKAAIKINGL